MLILMKVLKVNFPSPGGRGLRGRSNNMLKLHVDHPHPDPLPSREREFLGFYEDVTVYKKAKMQQFRLSEFSVVLGKIRQLRGKFLQCGTRYRAGQAACLPGQ